MIRTSPRTASAVLAVALLSLLAPATAALAATTDDPVEAAAGYLANQFTDDPAIATEWGPSHGQTIDAVLGLDAAGQAADLSADAAAWVAGQAEAYAFFKDESDEEDEGAWFAGSLGKLLLLASTRPEIAPEDMGGVDVLAQLQAIECTADDEHCEEWELGTYRDEGDDFPSTTNQAYAVLGLAAVGATPSDEAITYLADQACDEGGFQHEQRAPDEPCSPDADVTGLTVQALHAAGAGDQAASSVAWLVSVQDDDGGFGGAGPTEPANANSTALAVQGLIAGGEQAAADDGVAFLLSLQAGCDADEELQGAIRYAASEEEAEAAGGGSVLATAQALPALAGVTLDAVSGDGASTQAPVLDCEAADAPDPDESDEDDDTTGDDNGTETEDPADDEEQVSEPEDEAADDDESERETTDDGVTSDEESDVTIADEETEATTSETDETDELARTGTGLGGLSGLAVALGLAGLLALRLRPRAQA